MCEFCSEYDGRIAGKTIRNYEWQHTKTRSKEEAPYVDAFILKGREDKKAGLFIVTGGSGARYYDIEYCFMCGRKLGE